MRKLFCITVLSAFVAVGSLFAQQGGGFVNPAQRGGKGGFQPGEGSGIPMMAFFEIEKAPDDAIIKAKGLLLEQLDDDEYVFKSLDSSGTIVVEIDADKWRGLTVTPADQVVIIGKMDRDGSKMKIDVKRIRMANPKANQGNARSPAGARQRQAVAPENCPHCSQSLAPASAGEPPAEPPARPRAGSNARGRR